jgi:ethanolamine utilization microcompartment shell protein EutS
MKISASAVELGFEDDFSDSWVSVFVNSFSVTSSLCAEKMSASAVELGFLDDFWVPGSKFLSTVSKPAVVYVH